METTVDKPSYQMKIQWLTKTTDATAFVVATMTVKAEDKGVCNRRSNAESKKTTVPRRTPSAAQQVQRIRKGKRTRS
jgi:hypothetical protein